MTIEAAFNHMDEIFTDYEVTNAFVCLDGSICMNVTDYETNEEFVVTMGYAA